MEFTNGRSMEIYAQLGLASQLREIAVPEKYSFNEIITTGLSDHAGKRPVHVWERPSPEELRSRGKRVNDGTGSREPYMRCSQMVIEKFLKDFVEKEADVRGYFGWRFVGLEETKEGVVSEAVANDGTGRRMRIRSEYVVGCDGGGSAVRRAIGVKAERKDL